VPTRDVAERAAALVKRVKELESGAKTLMEAVSENVIVALLEESLDLGTYRAVVARVPDSRPAGMRGVWDILRARGADAAVLISVDADTGKPIFLAAGTDMSVAAGFDAGALVREIAPLLGGRGGGRPAMAQGGGDDPQGIDEALGAARRLLGA